jgi:hypothetical protein
VAPSDGPSAYQYASKDFLFTASRTTPRQLMTFKLISVVNGHLICQCHHNVVRFCFGQGAVVVGQNVDAQDCKEKWFEARVVESTPRYVRVNYYAWPDPKFDEYLAPDSYRLAVLHSQTQPKHVPRQITAPVTPPRDLWLASEKANAVPRAKHTRTRNAATAPMAPDKEVYVH